MSVSFDFNFWNALFLTLNFGLAIYGITSARSRASAQELDHIKADSAKALESHKEKVGQTFVRMGERLQAVETDLKNSITHEDLSAVHKRVDEVLKTLGNVGATVSRVEGLLEGMTRNKQL